MSDSIQRIEVTEDLLRIYLILDRPIYKPNTSHFYLATDNKERCLYKGLIPTHEKNFTLKEQKTSLNIPAHFLGNRAGGEITISLKDLHPFDRFYAQIETFTKLTFESPWHEKVSKKSSSLKTVVLIPCYNVEKYCEKVVLESVKNADHVIAVDDGSSDQTGAILQSSKNKHKNLHVLTFRENQGKGAALVGGFRYALEHFDFNALLTIDGDGQHRASDIPYLFEGIAAGDDLVIGSRNFQLMPLVRQFSNSFIAFFLKRVYPYAPIDTQSGLRAFNREMIEEIVKSIPEGRYEAEFAMLLMALNQHRKIKERTISTLYLDENISSHFSPLRDSYKILKVFFKHVWWIWKKSYF